MPPTRMLPTMSGPGEELSGFGRAKSPSQIDTFSPESLRPAGELRSR